MIRISLIFFLFLTMISDHLLLFCLKNHSVPSGPETQMPHAWPSDLAMRAPLSLQRDFLMQRQSRVKSLETAQQTINYWSTPVRQTASAEDLATLARRQNGHSALSEV
jgi:hypothetical protein